MKRFLVFFLIGLSWSHFADARISSDTFNAGEKVTAGKLFLNQVDMVSLYLSTERVVYVPKLTSDRQLNVDLTLLGMGATANESLKNFVMRHIHTFNKTLQERLEYHTPQLAKEFDPSEDVQFSIHVGAAKKKVATWAGGQWTWIGRVERVTAPRAEQVVPPKTVSAQPVEEEVVRGEKKRCEKKCPAMIGGE